MPSPNPSDPSQPDPRLEELAAALRARPEVLFAFVHGSYARTAQPLGKSGFRDIDIGVFVDSSQVPAEKELDFALALEDVLNQLSPHVVDVQVINSAPITFRYHVTEGDLLFTRSATVLSDFLEQTWREYLDFRPVAMQYLRDVA